MRNLVSFSFLFNASFSSLHLLNFSSHSRILFLILLILSGSGEQLGCVATDCCPGSAAGAGSPTAGAGAGAGSGGSCPGCPSTASCSGCCAGVCWSWYVVCHNYRVYACVCVRMCVRVQGVHVCVCMRA